MAAEQSFRRTFFQFQDNTVTVKKTLSLLTACMLAAASATATPAATAGPPAPTGGKSAVVTHGKPPGKTLDWHKNVVGDNRLEEYYAYSPSMDRNVPLFVMKPKNNSVPRPIVYILNGGDGGEGLANWVAQSDLVDFYRDKNVRIVMPMSGQFSYYSDWKEESDFLGGKQMWETFMTKELPGAMEKELGASSQRGIIGMSMSATTTILYAEHLPGFYDAVGSFSGCAETSRGFAYEYVRMVLDRGKADPEQMWGPVGGETFNYNDGLLNAARLKGTKHIYVSSGTGLMGPYDWTFGNRKPNFFALVNKVIAGGIIEAGVNKCSHDLKARTDQLGFDHIDWNFRPTGTHSWGYWQRDLIDSWPTFARAFGMDPSTPEIMSQQTPPPITDDTVTGIWKATLGTDPRTGKTPGDTPDPRPADSAEQPPAHPAGTPQPDTETTGTDTHADAGLPPSVEPATPAPAHSD